MVAFVKAITEADNRVHETFGGKFVVADNSLASDSLNLSSLPFDNRFLLCTDEPRERWMYKFIKFFKPKLL